MQEIMKRTMTYWALVVIMLLLPMVARGYSFVQDGIYYDVVDGEAIVTNNGQSNCYSGDVVIPEMVTSGGTTYAVTGIGKNAFMLCSNLTHVTIPGTVTSIGNNAFCKCDALTSIDLPRSLRFIGAYAFSMSNITSVTIPDAVTTIDHYAFYACTALETLKIGKSVTSIGDNAFNACFQITTLIWNAKHCSSTGSMITAGIDSVAVGDKVELIPAGFLKSSKVTSVTLPNSVTIIGSEAFFDCTLLSGISIPGSVTYIRDYAFYNCRGLTSISLGHSVETIGESAFENCSGLVSVIIPNSVTTIGGYAFEGCSRLISVTIGKGVTNIGSLIFYSCSQLTNVACLAVTPPSIDYGLFDDMGYYDHATLHVPQESLGAYQSALYWKDFYQIIGDITENYSPADVNHDGEINIGDANNVIDIVILGGNGGHTRIPVDGEGVIGDVNGDGEVNIADINAIINEIISGVGVH